VCDGLCVGLHMRIIICVLSNDTSNSSDCVLWNDWLTSGEFIAKNCNDYHALSGTTVSIFLGRTEDNLQYLSHNVPIS